MLNYNTFLLIEFFIILLTASVSIKLSFSPEITKPDAGQGAKKLKSYFPAGGLIKINLGISGLRIKSCIPTQDPKEIPQIQKFSESVF